MVLTKNKKYILPYILPPLALLSSCGAEVRVRLAQESVSNLDPKLSLVNFSPTKESVTALSASFTWNSITGGASLYFIYQEGDNAIASDCKDAVLLDKVQGLHTIDNLKEDTAYTYKFCLIQNEQILAKSDGLFRTYKSIEVLPIYTGLNAINEYVLNDGADIFSSTQAACNIPLGSLAATDSYTSCVHAGLLFRAELPLGVSCPSVKAYDELGVLHWICENSSPAIIKSTGLKDGGSLSRLFNKDGFLKISLNVDINNIRTFVSEKELWWTNPVSQLPSSPAGGVITLGNEGSPVGRVYLFSEKMTGGSYFIDEHKVSLIGLSGAELQLEPGGSTPLIELRGEITNFLRHIWVEGAFNTKGNAPGFIINSASALRLHNITVYDSTGSRAYIGILFSPLMSMLSSYRLQGFSEALRVTSLINGANLSTFYRGVVSNSGWPTRAVNFDDSDFNKVQDLTIAYSAGDSLAYPGSYGSFRNITISKATGGRGIRGSFSYSTLFHSILIQGMEGSSNNGISGFTLSNSTFSNILIGDTSAPIDFGGNSTNNSFTNNLILNQTNCWVSGAGNEGVDHATCAPSAPSDASLNISLDSSVLFVEAINSDDAKNASDNNGLIVFSEALDLINFESFFRVYGSGVLASPCLSATCSIWDFKLRDDPANLAFNRSLDSTTTNEVFVPGQTCPSAVHGSETLVHSSQTFLSHATELIEDGVGDDDFLCESNEECLYNPHYGAYQGSGDYYAQGSCLFQDGGSVVGVIMYAYPQL